MTALSRLVILVAVIFVMVNEPAHANVDTKSSSQEEQETTYGVDVSFPIFKRISVNYPWLPHNVDPANNPTPKNLDGMPLQPLGDRQVIYNNHLMSCRAYYGKKDGNKCDIYEYDRMLMNQRQPQR